MDWLTYFAIFLKATLTSTGGFAPLPSLHADLTSRGWASEHHFAESIAVGQVSPGPNGLWVVSLGYVTGGLLGALLATIAICIPPLFVLIVARLHDRLKSFAATKGVLDGLVLAIIGSGVVVLAQLFISNGVGLVTVGIALVAAALAFTGRVPTWLLLIGAGLAGVVLLP